MAGDLFFKWCKNVTACLFHVLSLRGWYFWKGELPDPENNGTWTHIGNGREDVSFPLVSLVSFLFFLSVSLFLFCIHRICVAISCLLPVSAVARCRDQTTANGSMTSLDDVVWFLSLFPFLACCVSSNRTNEWREEAGTVGGEWRGQVGRGCSWIRRMCSPTRECASDHKVDVLDRAHSHYQLPCVSQAHSNSHDSRQRSSRAIIHLWLNAVEAIFWTPKSSAGIQYLVALLALGIFLFFAAHHSLNHWSAGAMRVTLTGDN